MSNKKTISRRNAKTGKVVKQTAAEKTQEKTAESLRLAHTKHAAWKKTRAVKLEVMEKKAEIRVRKAQKKWTAIAERRANFEAKAAERLDKMLAKHDPKAKLRRKLVSYQKKMAALELALSDE